MKDDIMPRILIYGEDGLTLKYTKERLGEILHELQDNSNPADCTVFFRPSFGRGTAGYGEFDAIIISQEKAYLVEAKWDGGRDLSGPRKQRIRLRKDQIRRHEIFKWFRQYWNGEVEEAWDRFAEKNNPEFEKEFTFRNKAGKRVWKSMHPLNKLQGRNTQTILKEIGNRKLENVLLIFHRDKKPEVHQDHIKDHFTIVFVEYSPTFSLFTELE